MSTLQHEDQYTFLIISCSVLLRKEMFQTEVVEKIETNFFLINLLLFFIFYEIMWKSIIEPCRPQMTIRCMHISC